MTLERTYNIPLRKEFLKAPRQDKTKKAAKALKEFLARHMKCDISDVKIGRVLNMEIWARGLKNPPHHVKVTATKDDDGIVKAELFGFKYEEVKQEEEKKETKKKSEDKEAEKLEKDLDDVLGGTTEKPVKEVKAEVIEEKKEEKKETKPKAKASSKKKSSKE